MKNIITISIIFTILVINGCQKLELSNNEVNNLYKKSSNQKISPSNFFSETQINQYYEILDDAIDILKETKSVKIFQDYINLEISKSNLPSIDKNISKYQVEIFKEYFKEVDENNYELITHKYLNRIYSDNALSEGEKENLAKILLYSKYTFDYFLLSKGYPSFKTCWESQLCNVFCDDNPVDDLIVISGWPSSFAGFLAYCAYDQLFL